MGNRLHLRVKRTKEDIQQCKDCNGNGSMLNPVRPPRLMDCATCNGQGFIEHRAPYRLADGTWSDGVDRRLRLTDRGAPGRWEVWKDNWGCWIAWHNTGGDLVSYDFDTHAEAIAYAERMARTN